MHFICACIFFSPWQETYLPNYVSLRLLLKFVCVPQTYTTASREKAALSDRVFENTQMYLCVQIQLCLYSHTHKTSNSLWSETQQHIVGQESCCKTSLKCRELWLKSIIFFNDFFFFWLCQRGIRDLSSLSRDWTHASCVESQPLDCQGSPRPWTL